MNPCPRPGCGGTLLRDREDGALVCHLCSRAGKPVNGSPSLQDGTGGGPSPQPDPQATPPAARPTFEEARARYRRLRAAGHSVSYAAGAVDVALSTGEKWEGIEERRAEVDKLSRMGFTAPTIAAKLGVSKRAVTRARAEALTPGRGGEAQRARHRREAGERGE